MSFWSLWLRRVTDFNFKNTKTEINIITGLNAIKGETGGGEYRQRGDPSRSDRRTWWEDV